MAMATVLIVNFILSCVGSEAEMALELVFQLRLFLPLYTLDIGDDDTKIILNELHHTSESSAVLN